MTQSVTLERPGPPQAPSQSPPPPPARTLGIGTAQVLASALAAVTSALAASFLGVAGAIIGAAVGSVVATIGGALYAHSLRTAGTRLRQVRALDSRRLVPARAPFGTGAPFATGPEVGSVASAGRPADRRRLLRGAPCSSSPVSCWPWRASPPPRRCSGTPSRRHRAPEPASAGRCGARASSPGRPSALLPPRRRSRPRHRRPRPRRRRRAPPARALLHPAPPLRACCRRAPRRRRPARRPLLHRPEPRRLPAVDRSGQPDHPAEQPLEPGRRG